jgi:Fungal protein kinase
MRLYQAQPSSCSYISSNDDIFSHSSSVYAFDSSFGMESTQQFHQSSQQPFQLQPTNPLNPTMNQQSTSIDLEEGPENSDRESFPPSGTPDRSKRQSAAYQVPSTTPVIRRITSYRHFLPAAAPARERVTAREMGVYLAIELDGLKATKIVSLPDMVFPDTCLPFPVDESLLSKLENVWDPAKKVLDPPLAYTEEAVQNWFNAIANDIASVRGINKPLRNWSAAYCNTVIPDKELARKPDVILIDNNLVPVDWRSVHAVTEVTSRESLHSEMMKTINNKTYLMFSTQLNRRFVPFLAVCAKKVYFFVTDREGQTVTEISYRQRGAYHALNLIRIIVALMFASPETYGYDPTMDITTKRDIKTISCNGGKYKVKSTIHVVRGIVGRSTRVWSTIDKNKETFVIKDGWIQKGRADAEKQYLEQLKGVTGVPTLIWGGTVQIHDPKDPKRQRMCDDDTAWIRHGFSDESKYRIHRRLILSPVGVGLSKFTSLGELVSALRDVAVGMFMPPCLYLSYAYDIQ